MVSDPPLAASIVEERRLFAITPGDAQSIFPLAASGDQVDLAAATYNLIKVCVGNMN